MDGTTGTTHVGSSVPFEDGSRPFAARLLETVKQAFAEPVRLFSNLSAADIGPPVVYAVIIVLRVHADEPSPYQHLPAGRYRTWDPRRMKHLRATVLVDDDCAHRFPRMKMLPVLRQGTHLFA